MNPVDKLSFDILGEVFSHYAEDEDIFFPLETLLLVSQSWSQAALGHRALWAQLRIYLGHEPTGKIWRARLPLRLKRAGTSVPLQITLYDIFQAHIPDDALDHELYSDFSCVLGPGGGQKCPCWSTNCELTRSLLRLLAGPDGEYCKRWKSLNIVMGPSDSETRSQSFDELSYPTPLLSNLSMESLAQSNSDSHKILPFMPLLKCYKISQCRIKSLPDLSAAKEITLDFDYFRKNDLPNLSALKEAKLHECLKLSMRKWSNELYDIGDKQAWPFELPIDHPRLRSLSLHGGRLPSNLAQIRAPLLAHLTLEFDQSNLLAHIVDDCKLPLFELQHLSFWWEGPASNFDNLRISCTHLLRMANKLLCIEGDKYSLSLILKIFWEADSGKQQWAHSWAGKMVDILYSDRYGGEAKSGPHRIALAGRSCKVDIEMLVSLFDLFSPTLRWHDIRAKFKTYFG